ncbi:Adenylate cyclase type 3, partial [Fragariocoptes setiger]
ATTSTAPTTALTTTTLPTITIIAKLTAKKFDDVDSRRLYRDYYAQVKRNVFPTAVIIVMLMSSLLLALTVVHLDDQQLSQSTSSTTTATSSVSLSVRRHWPLAAQILIFITTSMVLLLIKVSARRESRLSSSAFKSSSSSSSSNCTQPAATVAAIECGDGNDTANELSSFVTSSLHNTAVCQHCEPSSDTTLANTVAATSAGAGAGAGESGDPSGVKRRGCRRSGKGKTKAKAKMKVKVNNNTTTTTTAAATATTTTPTYRGSAGGRDHRLWCIVPFVIYVCQYAQIVSAIDAGPWPTNMIVTFCVSLLYTYTIYVIFPLRLTTCTCLALCLSVPQLVSSMLLSSYSNNNISNQSIDSNVNDATTTPSIGLDNEDEADNGDSESSTLSMMDPFSSSLNTTITTTASKQPQQPLIEPTTGIWAYIVLLIGINCIGILSFIFHERQQRAAFLETRQSLETKLVLEQESQEQERLLLSILPKHLASEIRQDLGAVVTGQFKKIYMSRHENVSILFADIVGFTAISSTCPAPELVRTLNELFARFDKLAEKYHQLRIKILGDCYYAISGAPQERPDHAVLCVHMGLSMVDAIKSVREQTRSTVDMRVGVHTGGVLAGVLGQRQWQFDVYSKDVELANKMESSGLPGRVHISDATLRFLNGEFEITDGDGASREEALRLAGIKTYLIVRVLKPYPEGTLDALRPRTSHGSNQSSCGNHQMGTAHCHHHANSDSNNNNNNKYGSNNTTTTIVLDRQTSSSVPNEITHNNSHNNNDSTTDTCIISPDGAIRDPEEYKRRLHEELLRRQNRGVDHEIKALRLKFRNREYESQFRSTTDTASYISFVGMPLVLLCSFCAYALIFPIQLEPTFAFIAVGVALFIINRQFELTNRRLFLWRKEVEQRKEKVADMRQKNEALVYNILPPNVAKIFLGKRIINDEELYNKSYDAVGVLFAAMPNFSDFYTEESVNNQGLECLRVLNEVISDYDALLDQPRFRNIIKIKTMGSTYMAASGLYEEDAADEAAAAAAAAASTKQVEVSDAHTVINKVVIGSADGQSGVAIERAASSQAANDNSNNMLSPTDGNTIVGGATEPTNQTDIEAIKRKWAHLAQLTEFALALKETLNNFNKESFNKFVLRMGINQGPITAGVIGVKKPHFDMWGNTVNVASRMESTGRAGSIQVVEETARILEHFSFKFDQRGLVSVKGKGKLMTFYLTDANYTVGNYTSTSSP